MDEKLQIIFMQMRLLRMASRKWKMTLQDATRFFKQHGVFGYIEQLFGVFHVEGDEAVFNDICNYVKLKGAII